MTIPNSINLANLWHFLTRNTKITENVLKNTTLREDTQFVGSQYSKQWHPNVEKKTKQKDFDGNDSTIEESIGQSEAYHTESREHDEPSEESAPKAVLRRMERKRIGSHVFDGEGVVHNQSTKQTQSKRRSDGPLGKKNVVSIFSTTELTLTLRHVTKGIRSKSKRKT